MKIQNKVFDDALAATTVTVQAEGKKNTILFKNKHIGLSGQTAPLEPLTHLLLGTNFKSLRRTVSNTQIKIYSKLTLQPKSRSEFLSLSHTLGQAYQNH
jgi:hypothetical protein